MFHATEANLSHRFTAAKVRRMFCNRVAKQRLTQEFCYFIINRLAVNCKTRIYVLYLHKINLLNFETMEVRDIFKLRKEGKTEEAYAAIRPMYAAHKGHYTTICMFWVGADMMALRYKQRRLEEAYKIFLALVRLYPTMDDKDSRGQSAIMRAALIVFDHNPKFSMLDFITKWDITRLTADDWTMGKVDGHPVPSLGIRIVGKVFREVANNQTVEMALKAAPILAESLKHAPYNMQNQRYKAMIYKIMGKTQKAINIYRHLIAHHRQSYLYQELADLVSDDKTKVALLCRAITTQREPKFTQKSRWQLANLLFNIDKARARYELDKCVELRRQAGFNITWHMQNLIETLKEVEPVSERNEREFYRQQGAIVDQLRIY